MANQLQVFATMAVGGLRRTRLHYRIDSTPPTKGSNTCCAQPGFADDCERPVKDGESLVHIGTYLLAHLAKQSGMTAGHESEDEGGQDDGHAHAQAQAQ